MFRPIAQTVAVAAAVVVTTALAAPASANTSPAAGRNDVTAAALPTCDHFTPIGLVRYPSAGGKIDCKLQLGTYNNWGVVALQQWLYYCNKAKQITIDGDYGTVTRDVVKWLQAVNGIPADGVYGPKTRSVLGKAMYKENTFSGCQ